jgi:uncharacterized protein YaaQ
MKLIIAILRDEDTDEVSQALITGGYRVTRIASTGGFLRKGSSTLMIGVDDERVDGAIQVVQDNLSKSVELGLKRATLFVLNVDRFTQV